MSSILLVTSSPRGAHSFSTRIAGEIAGSLAAGSGASIVRRDLAAEPLPHIDLDYLAAVSSPADTLSERQRGLLTASDRATAELLAADTVVIGVGLINFSIPSVLKSWFDHVARAQKTFSYSEAGPKGLATGKKVYVVLASKGIYTQGGPAAPMDHARPYLRTMLGFLGMTDVAFIDLEGLGLGLEPDAEIIARALGQAGEATGLRLAA